jgi:hypothetical protein
MKLVWVFAVLLPVVTQGQADSRRWMDCSLFMSSPRSTSYFVPSAFASQFAPTPVNSGNYDDSIIGCTGAITNGTRLAVMKNSKLAQEYLQWVERFGLGDNEFYIALSYKSLTGRWTWSDGTILSTSSTFWANDEPSANDCAVLNSYYSISDQYYVLSTVDCQDIYASICEITGN